MPGVSYIGVIGFPFVRFLYLRLEAAIAPRVLLTKAWGKLGKGETKANRGGLLKIITLCCLFA